MNAGVQCDRETQGERYRVSARVHGHNATGSAQQSGVGMQNVPGPQRKRETEVSAWVQRDREAEVCSGAAYELPSPVPGSWSRR